MLLPSLDALSGRKRRMRTAIRPPFLFHIYNEIKKHASFDRIFLEFGRVRYARGAQLLSSNFIFDENYEMTNKMVVRTDKILRHGLFLTTPFSFYSNQSIDPVAHKYGLRICAFNNSLVKNPFTENWNQFAQRSQRNHDEINDDFNDVDVSTMLHLSAIQFEPGGSVQNAVTDEKRQITRIAFIVAPSILIVLMVS
ncbi:unnamed protein product [Gongylonema pulchrum]|uniref:Glucuronosyltransferase n=1 Tax=Gongylonema pulchrum TaxID=637853 RepID=A0A183D337_9BILA|nr:unnamed protein product [Gongylonema pulchrum]